MEDRTNFLLKDGVISAPLGTFQNSQNWRGTNNPTIGHGAKLKASASNSPSWDGTNASGFTALPAGHRISGGGGFNYLGSYGYFWSAAETISPVLAWYRLLNTGNWQSSRNTIVKTFGFSVRCLQN